MRTSQAYEAVAAELADLYPEEGWSAARVAEVHAITDLDESADRAVARRRRRLPGRGQADSVFEAEFTLAVLQRLGVLKAPTPAVALPVA